MKKFFALALGFLSLFTLALGIKVNATGALNDSFELVKDYNQLEVGDRIVIANNDSTFAMGKGTAASKNRPAVAITPVENKLVPTADIEVITLEKGVTIKNGSIEVETFALKSEVGYLTSGSNTDNLLKVSDVINNESSWLFGENLVAQGEYEKNALQYYSRNKTFSCYGGTQKPVSIYVSELPKCNLTLNSNIDGSGSSVLPVPLNRNSILPTLTWKGHTFLGWETKLGLIQPGNTYRPDGDEVLNARWRVSFTCTTTFKLNDGVSEWILLEGLDSDKLALTEAITNPKRAGYTFDGWYYKLFGGEKVDIANLNYRDITLYAHWSKIGTSVTLDSTNLVGEGVITNSAYKFNGIDVTFDVKDLAIVDPAAAKKELTVGSQKGHIYNTTPFNSDITTIECDKTSNCRIYTSDKVITKTSTDLELDPNNGVYTVPEGHRYFRLEGTKSSTGKMATFGTMTFNLKAEAFEEVKTLAKLALTYTPNEDPSLATLNDVTLRFGGLIDKSLYQPDLYEYGVIIIDKGDFLNIDWLADLDREYLEYLKNNKLAVEAKAPAEVDGKIQFSWKIEYFPEDQRTKEFVSVLYRIDKDVNNKTAVATLSKHRYGSIKSVANDYLLNSENLGLTDKSLIKVLTDLSNL